MTLGGKFFLCAVKMLNLMSFAQICHSCEEMCLLLVAVYPYLTIRDKVGGILHENKGSLFLPSGFFICCKGKKQMLVCEKKF